MSKPSRFKNNVNDVEKHHKLLENDVELANNHDKRLNSDAVKTA
jgi:hypothetical protein